MDNVLYTRDFFNLQSCWLTRESFKHLIGIKYKKEEDN